MMCWKDTIEYYCKAGCDVEVGNPNIIYKHCNDARELIRQGLHQRNVPCGLGWMDRTYEQKRSESRVCLRQGCPGRDYDSCVSND